MITCEGYFLKLIIRIRICIRKTKKFYRRTCIWKNKKYDNAPEERNNTLLGHAFGKMSASC